MPTMVQERMKQKM